VCRPGTNEELRYSIRSVLQNTPAEKIWVIGGKPNWYTGNFIEVLDGNNKFENIKKCMSAIANSEEISDDFVSMHDDFFIIKKIKSMPVYHGGFLQTKVDEYIKINPRSYYANLLNKTLIYLQKMGYENPINYEIHVPMIMNKNNLSVALKKPYLERSMYGNIFNVGGTKRNDVKVYEQEQLSRRSYDYLNNDSEFVSSNDASFNKLYKDLLKDLFPNPSKYEN
jgi:hypothetical protein